MKKKEKKQLKKLMKRIREHAIARSPLDAKPDFSNSLAPSGDDVQFQIAAEEESESIYIKISGFNNYDHCIDYAEYLAKYLPLMLHKSEVMH